MSEMTAKGIKAHPAPAADPHPAHQPDGRTLEALYRQYWAELCKYLNRTFGPGPPDPEDVAQAAFAKYASLDDRSRIQNPRAFLYTTARHLVMDYQRQSKRLSGYIDDALYRAWGLDLEQITPERVLIEKERFQIIEAALKTLSPKQRTLLALHRLHGISYSEIRQRTGWSKADISRNMAAAVLVLKKALEEGRQDSGR